MASTSASSSKQESLREMIERKRRAKKATPIEETVIVEDPYQKATEYLKCQFPGKTALYYDEQCLKHECLWDENHPENPKRAQAIWTRFQQLLLPERCENLPLTRAEAMDQKYFLSIHDSNHLDNLEGVKWKNVTEQQEYASNFDSVYFCDETNDSAKMAANAVVKMAKEVAKGTYKNGFALVRPPGHHAMSSEFNGYCFLNNVAIAAQTLLNEKLAERILIVDFDVHHGQGIQQAFYDNKNVLYFSIHRYEFGTFWPNLRESNFSYTGEGPGEGFNINVPLNQPGMEDIDYLAIVHNILLPIAYEFKPQVILLAAGYDACIGCPEGAMLLSPFFYGHLVTLLSGLADGKIVACLEGGYYLPTLAEGAANTLKALLGDPCGQLHIGFHSPVVSPFITEVINNLRVVLNKHWKCLQNAELLREPPTDNSLNQLFRSNRDIHGFAIVQYEGEVEKPPFSTIGCYAKTINIDIGQEKMRLQTESLVNRGVGYFYDEAMLLHKEPKDKVVVERPERLEKILDLMKEYKLDERCVRIQATHSDGLEVLRKVHSAQYFDQLQETKKKTDVFVNEHTKTSILAAVNGLLSLIDAIMLRQITSGVALVRPPGHHAHYDFPSGFCFVNNAAVVANYLTSVYKLKKVLIVDFDVHHGDGTQQLTYARKDVMYLSIHRFDEATFFPRSIESNYQFVGTGEGRYHNINIPLNKGRMGNKDYMQIFHNLVLPIGYMYNPDFVIVSAGFDAGIGDTLGHYDVSPETFGQMVQLLKPLAQGNLLLCLEGGYNLETVAYSMCMCIKALLNDPIPVTMSKPLNPSVWQTIGNVRRELSGFWDILTIERPMYQRLYNSPTLFQLQYDHNRIGCSLRSQLLASSRYDVTIENQSTSEETKEN